MRRWGNFIALFLLFGVMVGVWSWRGGQSAFFLMAASAVFLGAALGTALFSLRAVSAESLVEETRVYAGQLLPVSLRVRHTSLWPVMWLVVQETWQHSGGEQVKFRQLVFPGFRTGLTLRYTLQGLKRGEYRSLGVELHTGDLFGLVQVRRSKAGQASFLVYPQPLDFAEGQFPRAVDEESAGGPVSEWRDYGIIRNVRPYEPGDPLQRIHWKLTARSGTLQTKTFEPAGSNRWVLCLDTASSRYAGTLGKALFEAAVRAAAGLTRQSLLAGSTWVKLRSCAREDAGIVVTSIEETRFAYEWLARVSPDGSAGHDEFLLHEALHLPRQDSIVWITSQSDGSLLPMFRRLRLAGRACSVVLVHTAPALSWPHRQWKRELEELGCRFAEVRTSPVHAEPHQPGTFGGVADGIA